MSVNKNTLKGCWILCRYLCTHFTENSTCRGTRQLPRRRPVYSPGLSLVSLFPRSLTLASITSTKDFAMLSRGTAIVLLVVYSADLFFQLKNASLQRGEQESPCLTFQVPRAEVRHQGPLGQHRLRSSKQWWRKPCADATPRRGLDERTPVRGRSQYCRVQKYDYCLWITFKVVGVAAFKGTSLLPTCGKIGYGTNAATSEGEPAVHGSASTATRA